MARSSNYPTCFVKTVHYLFPGYDLKLHFYNTVELSREPPLLTGGMYLIQLCPHGVYPGNTIYKKMNRLFLYHAM